MRTVLLISASLFNIVPVVRANEGKLLAQSEPGIQDQIRRLTDALQSGADPHTDVAAIREVEALEGMAADKGEIVKQVAIFAYGSDEERPLIALRVLHLLELPPKTIIRVLAPYLDAENDNLRSFVRDWFQGHDNAGSGVSPLEPSNYKDYVSYIRGLMNMHQPIPAAFVQYIYERSPNRALLAFYYANRERDKSILLSEHLIGNAIWLKDNDFDERFERALPEANEEIAKLSNHQDWWARLYVVRIMEQHRELRQDKVLAYLSADDNELVRDAAKSASN